MNYKKGEIEVNSFIATIILILDIAKDGLKEKCVEIIKDESVKHNICDLLYQLEYLGFQPRIFKQMIVEEEIR